MYNLHHTEGIILASADFGEADRIYNIYSKDFGKILVLAKGVRLEKSKLREQLRPHSLVRFSFIEGKEFMRLTDAEEILQLPPDEKTHGIFAQVRVFFERLVKGQEKDEAVWSLLQSILLNTECLTSEGFEPLFRARLLHRLGYVSLPDGVLGKAISANDWQLPLQQNLNFNDLEKLFQKGLIASQL